jgi:SAM-dependent methyltransferase
VVKGGKTELYTYGKPEKMRVDPKQIVADGYDRIAERYVEGTKHVRVEERERYTELILSSLPAGSTVLELGCGTGLPTTKRLAERFRLTGIDLSPRHIQLARQNVPWATFIQGDMTTTEFPQASFDGVAAFYSITHVPRTEHVALLRSIAGWLRPGGLLVATMGYGDTEDVVEDDWLGAPMYFSHYDSETNKRLVAKAGFQIAGAQEETAEEDGKPCTFLWVVARKPATVIAAERVP